MPRDVDREKQICIICISYFEPHWQASGHLLRASFSPVTSFKNPPLSVKRANPSVRRSIVRLNLINLSRGANMPMPSGGAHAQAQGLWSQSCSFREKASLGIPLAFLKNLGEMPSCVDLLCLRVIDSKRPVVIQGAAKSSSHLVSQCTICSAVSSGKASPTLAAHLSTSSTKPCTA